ncbi:sensor histidine kinase [Streptomyces cinnamoneus]|uniref:sensor histidine kinase n=1 Tax=Streptomyces cinnamoneus TaxID=53446 RepID=UPI003F4CE89C
MSKVDLVIEGAWEGWGRQLAAALRGMPRAVREGLLTVARDPLPRSAWTGRLPHFHVLLLAVLLGWANAHSFARVLGTSALGLLLAALQTGAVALALSRPVLAWWLSTALLCAVAVVRDDVLDPNVLWPWSIEGIALHTLVLLLLALRVRLWVTAVALGTTILTGVVNTVLATHPHNQVVERGAVYFAAAAVLGAALRFSRVSRTRLVEQEQLTTEERARRTLLEERQRIARELHDVVAHHMSVISIQAQVAPHLVKDPSDELKENLAGIRQNAVEALTELRRVLGVLRSEDDPAGAARHAPQPELDRLDELVANVRGAGQAVEVDRSGTVRPLGPGVELSAFRIVQEALSNAMRHAPGSDVRVALTYGTAALTVRVVNTAPARPAPPSRGVGHGLPGMRERAAMLGGELADGPTPEGGYEIVAELPAPTATKDDDA